MTAAMSEKSSVGSYRDFIFKKSQLDSASGFKPIWIPDFLFDFQAHLTDYQIRTGRGGLFEDCGLGKTIQQLVWAENVVRKTNGHVLIFTPLAVSRQTAKEAERFGIQCERRSTGENAPKGITVTNYERLHHFRCEDYDGVVCDESSILKNFDGKTKAAVTEFMRRIPYRLLCTATAAPNDYDELGTSSEALGYLGYQDMLSRFFKEDIIKDYLGWGRKSYRFRGHAEEPFWKWVCSWARSCRKPSDLGFDDRDFVLPPLNEREIIVKCSIAREGELFARQAQDLNEQRQERRLTLEKRCESVSSMIGGCGGRPTVSWVHLNDEADLLEKMIPGAKQVSGSMSDDEKEEVLLAFSSGQLSNLVTKPKIGCWGLNWQHCSDVFTFASHSFEQYYQSVRRCYRFGQKREVNVSIVVSESEQRVLANLKRKSDACNAMFDSLCCHMAGAVGVDRKREFTKKEKIPSWLQSSK